MAEAVVESPASRYFFCHTCNVRIGRVQADFTCPTCGGGFVEEITDPQHENPLIPADLTNLYSLNSQTQGSAFSPFEMFLSGGGSRQGEPMRRGREMPLGMVELRQGPGGTFSMSMGGGTLPSGGPTGQENPMEQMLYTFLNDLMMGLGGGQPGTATQGLNMFGNLGDYVWGRDGLDAIVTQLMNQMEGSGPPPLADEKLDQLSTVRITAEQVAKKLQCSVCWENFALDEEVKQLDCDHVYHPPCILPWLKLHGTCPICRRDFTSGNTSEGSRSGSRHESRENTQAPFQFNIPQTPNASSSNTPFTTTSSTTTPTPPNQTRGQNNQDSNSSPRFDMDMEFD